jgi:Zn-finger nucleic acid-binding protein
MDCPKDHTPLKEAPHEGAKGTVFVDVCPACSGMYLDAHELAKLTGRKDVDHLLAGLLGVDMDGGELVCPHDGGLMGARHFVGHEGTLTLNACTTCHGVWLDKGEAEAVAKLTPDALESARDEDKASIMDEDKAVDRDWVTNPLAQALAPIAHSLRHLVERFD